MRFATQAHRRGGTEIDRHRSLQRHDRRCQGRAYVGNFGFDRHAGEKQKPAVLARVDPDGSCTGGHDLAFPTAR